MTLAKQIRQTVATSTSSIDEILAGVKAGRGPAGMLLRDEAVEAQIRESLKNAQQATANLDHASHQADALISDLNSQQMPQKVGMVVDSLSDTAKQAHQMVSEIAQPDRQGVTAGTNIRESLMNANAASLNLADDTEALKHNFLLRGFFRRRGYYNLDRISPEQYRRDAAFTSRANYRAWLSASELFQPGSDGQEELSAGGKGLLDGALTENGDSIFESPIVIEGYCNGTRPAGPAPALSNPRDPGPPISPEPLPTRLEQSRNRRDEELATERDRAENMGRNLHRGPEEETEIGALMLLRAIEELREKAALCGTGRFRHA